MTCETCGGLGELPPKSAWNSLGGNDPDHLLEPEPCPDCATPLTDKLTRDFGTQFQPDVDVIGEWRASHRALEAALLRCLREIQPHHIPGDVYTQAQHALGDW